MYASKTVFGRIRIRAWYCYLNKIAWNKAVDKQSQLVSKAQLKVNQKVPGANKLLRKQKSILDRFLRNGLVFNPEFSAFLREREARYVDKNKRSTILGLYSGQDWKVYSRAEQTPEKMLVPDMDKNLFAGSESIFEDGPYEVFKVLKSSNLRDAVNSFLGSFKLIAKGLYELNDKKNVDELFEELNSNDVQHLAGEYRLNHLNELVNRSFCITQNAFTFEEFPPKIKINRLEEAWLRLALGYLKSKFFDNSMDFACACFKDKTLEIIEEEMGIQAYRWFSKAKPDKENIMIEFYRVIEYIESHPYLACEFSDQGIDYKSYLGQY